MASTLRPVRANTLNADANGTVQRRASRTVDIDFEAALLTDNTFRLTEGLDVAQLGLDHSPAPLTPVRRPQPPTPIVVPPTPTPVAGPSRRPPSPPSENDDDDRAPHRRSMYRAPGTSSSPDLATLLRKAKERGGVLPKSRHDSPPPIPNQITSIAYAGNPPKSKNRLQRTTTNGDEKTSAFLGKMLGSGTVRERSFLPSPSRLYHTPVGSPIADVFSSPRTPDTTKPLPPIMGQTRELSDDDNSLVIVERLPRTPSPPEKQTLPPDPPPSTRQRRSMSVGEVELKKIVAQGRRKDPDDPTLSNILDEFQGQLAGLAAPLELRDPAHRVQPRSKTDPTPKLTLHLSPSEDEEPPVVPPRSASLQMPSPSARPRGARVGSSPLRTRSGNSDSDRLRIMHGSSASYLGALAHPLPYRLAQQELSVNDLTLTRVSSHSPARAEDPEDMEVRGKELATRCWKEDEEFLGKEKIAEWLGSVGAVNKIALRHYINFFDFTGLRLDLAFRRLCAKLYLKAETQQVDRILEEFSRRYWECNPGGLYGSANLVHAVSYSLLLLNTDLHVADLATRMSRTQFVRNTLTAIQMQLQPTPSQASTPDLTHDSGSVRAETIESTPPASRSKRSDSITSWHSVSREAASTIFSPIANESTPSVQIEPRTSVSSMVYGRAWENDMESLLKSQQILQPLNSSRSSMGSLSPGPGSMLRHRSQRGPPDRLATLKRGSIRGLQSILGAQNASSPYSSNSSIDGRTSPSPSFATSTHDAIYNSSSSFLTPTLGFASNLSHTIIREAQEDDDRSVHSGDSNSTDISISDEELALLGAPWAKEGMLCRKQYWESVGKRARDKAWLDVFVVIQKGELNMFTFGENSPGASGAVGGGNWLSNANTVGTVQLAHSLAHSLPSPGYNRQRPYCMVLTLANGGVYFFQAGTEELVNEWVSTKEPLAGGVSNMEYGWNRIDDPTHGRSQSETEAADMSDMVSVRSGRSTRSKFGWRDGAATVRGSSSPWADRTYINDWKAPMPPSVSSPHDEETQLEALRKHVASMKRDLKQHNEYREPMSALYQPRSANAVKAQSNWEKKSQYLLTEIVKYDSYIDSLQAAMSLRLKKRGEKGKWKGLEQTIEEDEEPLTPANKSFGSQLHRRETADGGGGSED
ncbi:hypothetical protein C8R46DRAFT_1054279 [Mycena filopes]|nr:hypothetical protein C8R46DRAFT_1054279 [Mycena filopes]